MDFVTGLPKIVKGHNVVWVNVDSPTKSAHFIPICSTYSMDQYAQLYIQEMVRLHGVPLSVIKPQSGWLPMKHCMIESVDRREVGEKKLLGLDLIREMIEAAMQIRQRMGTAQSRQKSYSDQRRRMLEFSIGNRVFLNVAPMKEIIEKIGDVAYILDLPASMAQVYNIFHVSMLRKYVANPPYILKHEPIELKADLSYEEIPVEMLL
ncbi:hypothetical protein DH2020_043529 [Rehmannia glutinosa]|uniref:Tf2-1-like SH3-like domain-containing protein n=1 Tax=Rehmannia glutinosa TaxID=99300 RepID=A0ABR0UJD7_REHGL